MAAKKRRLGRGLDALLAGAATDELVAVDQTSAAIHGSNAQPAQSAEKASSRFSDQLQQLPLDLIQRGKYQPRRDLQPEALDELAASIRSQGVLQPIVVREIGDNRYEIIAGERRWRATQQAGLDKIPALVRDVPDEAAIAMALIENIQREDLNALEEALALARLRDEFSLTQQEVADAVGKSRASVANLLRLLTLRDDVKIMVEHGDIEYGHAKALLGLPAEQQTAAAGQVVARGMSVRQTEELVRSLLAEDQTERPAPKDNIDPDIRRLQVDIGERVGVPVKVQHSARGKGKLIFSYSSLDELEGILDHIK